MQAWWALEKQQWAKFCHKYLVIPFLIGLYSVYFLVGLLGKTYTLCLNLGKVEGKEGEFILGRMLFCNFSPQYLTLSIVKWCGIQYQVIWWTLRVCPYKKIWILVRTIWSNFLHMDSDLKLWTSEISSLLAFRCISSCPMHFPTSQAQCISCWKILHINIVCGVFNFICGCSSDTLVEQDAEGTSVAEIFKLYGEGFFRDKEVG